MFETILLKAELLCSGLRTNEFSDELAGYFNPNHLKRTGFVGVHLRLGAFTVNALMDTVYDNQGIFTNSSPFEIQRLDDRWHLLRSGRSVAEVSLIPQPSWYGLRLSTGELMSDILLYEGEGNLMGSITPVCEYHRCGGPCAFCGLNQEGRDCPQPSAIAETVFAAYREDPSITLTLNGGNTLDPTNGMAQYLEYIIALRDTFLERSDRWPCLPLQVEAAPSQDMGVIDALVDLGVGSFSMNLECFDETYRRSTCPMKSLIHRDLYFANWHHITERLGPYHVASVLIYGLEDSAATLEGTAALLAVGVFPNISPFRPMPGSVLADRQPPDYVDFFNVSLQTAEDALQCGVPPSARLGCFTCGGCSVERDCMTALAAGYTLH